MQLATTTHETHDQCCTDMPLPMKERHVCLSDELFNILLQNKLAPYGNDGRLFQLMFLPTSKSRDRN